MVGLAAILAAQTVFAATPVVTTVTQADIDALDPNDIIWNAQFYPGAGGTPNQYSVGPGFNGIDSPEGTTTWAFDPSLNPISVDYSASLTANANNSGNVIHGVSDPFHEVWFIVRDNTPPTPGSDFLALAACRV